MDRIKVENHNNINILVIDYSGLKHDELLEFFKVAAGRIVESVEGTVRLLEIVHNVSINELGMKALFSYVKVIDPYLKKYAAIGALPQVLTERLKNKGSKIEFFLTKAEGIQYLISS